MDALYTFLDMSGYAAFVWPSYAVTALVLVLLLVFSLKDLRANRSLFARLQARGSTRRRGGRSPAAETAQDTPAVGEGHP